MLTSAAGISTPTSGHGQQPLHEKSRPLVSGRGPGFFLVESCSAHTQQPDDIILAACLPAWPCLNPAAFFPLLICLVCPPAPLDHRLCPSTSPTACLPGCPQEAVDLMHDCGALEPTQRPSAQQVMQRLRVMQSMQRSRSSRGLGEV